MHLAVIGAGRVGRATLGLLVSESWISNLTIIDTAPGVAAAVGEEVRHCLASTRLHMDIITADEDASVQGADIVLVTAGAPRSPDMQSRTDLVERNARVIQIIAQAVVPNNPSAVYVVVTNPVDAMATLFKRISGAKFVISAGTNLDSQRFRSELAKRLAIPITEVSGFVGGEHGNAAVFLWSTVRIAGTPLDEYIKHSCTTLDRAHLEHAVKEISRLIIRTTGGTRLGPATSFRDIVRSIALDEKRVLAVAVPYEASGVPDPVMVSGPHIVGRTVDPTFEGPLTRGETAGLQEAAQRIHQTYCSALELLDWK